MTKKNSIKKANGRSVTEWQSVESIANTMAYSVQDLLDSFSHGGQFNFAKTEKYFLGLLKDAQKLKKK